MKKIAKNHEKLKFRKNKKWAIIMRIKWNKDEMTMKIRKIRKIKKLGNYWQTPYKFTKFKLNNFERDTWQIMNYLIKLNQYQKD